MTKPNAIIPAVLLFAAAVYGVGASAEKLVLEPAPQVTFAIPYLPAAALSPTAHHMNSTPTEEHTSRTTPEPAPEPVPFLLGVYTPKSPGDRLRAVADWETTATTVNAVLYFRDFSREIAQPDLERIVRSGRTPIVGWEPWLAGQGTTQPDFTLRSITDGTHDTLIRRSAQNVARIDAPIIIRFAHEMNGDWYPWSERVNGNSPGEYVQAWRHVREIFRQEGAGNVRWMWSPNVATFLPHPLADLWPGAEHVDAVGMVGYLRDGQSLAERYDATLAELEQLSPMPVIITETSVQPGPGRADTIRRFLCDATTHPRIAGLVWFDDNQRADWRLAGDAQAFRAGAAGDCPEHEPPAAAEEVFTPGR